MPDSPTNAEFFAKYDALMQRWPVAVDTFDIPGRYGTTHVNACGPADAPVVVLMHGGRATSAVWYGNVAALAETHRVYAIDAIGDNGRSVDDGERLVGRDGFCRWLGETLDALNVSRTAIVAHSFGAWTSMQYALHAPNRITALALLDPTACLVPNRVTFNLRGVPLFVGRAPGRWRSFFEWETHGHAVDAEFLDLWAAPFRSVGGVKLGMPRRPAAREIAGFHVPTLVVVAGRSRQNNSRRLTRAARRLPDVRVLTLRDATHFTLPQEYPHEINAAIAELLRSAAVSPEQSASPSEISQA